MNIPTNLLYTKDHEWAKIEKDIATVGITDYAQGELGDIVFIELPQAGNKVTRGASFGTIEAVKAVSDIYAPFSGEIADSNAVLQDAPEAINKDPYGEGWMIKIKLSDPSQKSELLTADQYKALLGEA
jgi:glycine cleavage system H protein